MSPNKTPLQVVNEEHGGKEKLVDKIMGLVERGEQEAGDLKTRLLAASNKKLLRLAENAETIRSRYGSRDKLVGAVAEAIGRAKDSDYVKKLDRYTPGRLLDMAQSFARRARKEGDSPAAPKAARPKAATAAKPKATKKPAAKKPATKKPAAKKK
jgi:hypothetical protein